MPNAFFLVSILFALAAIAKWQEERLHSKMSKYIGDAGERRSARILRKIDGLSFSNDLVIQTNKSSTQIDHVVQYKGAIIVIEVKNWKGIIECEQHKPIWEITMSEKRERRPNPILQAKRQAKILSDAIGYPVGSFVLMMGSAKPYGKWPEGITTPKNLSQHLDIYAQKCAKSSNRDEAWHRVERISQDRNKSSLLSAHIKFNRRLHKKEKWRGWAALSAMSFIIAMASQENFRFEVVDTLLAISAIRLN